MSELCTALQKGFHGHVKGFVVHALLASMAVEVGYGRKKKLSAIAGYNVSKASQASPFQAGAVVVGCIDHAISDVMRKVHTMHTCAFTPTHALKHTRT